MGRLKVLLDWIKQIQINEITQGTFEKKRDILAYKYFLLRKKDLEEETKRYEYHKKEINRRDKNV